VARERHAPGYSAAGGEFQPAEGQEEFYSARRAEVFRALDDLRGVGDLPRAFRSPDGPRRGDGFRGAGAAPSPAR